MKEYEWIFHALIALGTFLAVMVALFGDWIKGRWFRPRLELVLERPRGVPQKTAIVSPDGSVRHVDARYYHLKVRNRKRWPIATHVQVHLLRIEEPRIGGGHAVKWVGDLPLRWRNQDVSPIERSVGPDADVDILAVVKDKWVTLDPLVIPIDFPMHNRREPVRDVILTLQARGAEADSELVRVSVSWNGQWADGETEMADNLVAKVL